MQRDAAPFLAPDAVTGGCVRAETASDRNSPPITVSLVLGSGGARGLAHIGVIQWLIENGYQIGSIAGSSIGSLIGGIYAAGKLDVYVEWVSALEPGQVLRLLDPAFGRSGLFKGERVMGVLRDLIGDHAIEALPVPFTAVATDLASGEEVWLREGKLFDAIRASIATPFIFTPFRHGARVLADGALANPLPIAPTHLDTTDLTVAVDLSGLPEPRLSPPPPVAIRDDIALRRRMRDFIEFHLERASDVSVRWVTDMVFASMAVAQEPARSATRSPDVTVEIPCNACGPHQFWRARELIELGRGRTAQAFEAARHCGRRPQQRRASQNARRAPSALTSPRTGDFAKVLPVHSSRSGISTAC